MRKIHNQLKLKIPGSFTKFRDREISGSSEEVHETLSHLFSSYRNHDTLINIKQQCSIAI